MSTRGSALLQGAPDPWHSRGVSKRRNIRWIVAGGVGFVALFCVTLLLVESNRPEPRLDRALNEIYDEYAFEQVDMELIIGELRQDVLRKTYIAPLLTEAELALIYSRIDDDYGSSLEISFPFNYSDGSQGCIFRLRDRDFTTKKIVIIKNGKLVMNSSEPSPFTAIFVTEYRPPSLLIRLKNLWPW